MFLVEENHLEDVFKTNPNFESVRIFGDEIWMYSFVPKLFLPPACLINGKILWLGVFRLMRA